jgi:hypothetical protein
MGKASNTHGREMRCIPNFGRRPEGKRSIEYTGADGTLRWNFKKEDAKAWTGYIWFMYGPMAGSCELGNETSSSIRLREFLE